jgi:hypothetical protein
MKAYGRVKIKLHPPLNLGKDGVSGQLQAPAVLPSGESVSTSEHTGDCWIGSRTGLDAPDKKNLLLVPGPAIAHRLQTSTRYAGLEGTSAYAVMTVDVFRH